MEDFPLLILFFIIYLIAGSTGKKKRKNKTDRRGPMRTSAQGEQHDKRASERDRQTKEGFQSAFPQAAFREEHACDQSRMHLHEVTDEQLLHAAEGEDPCHAGGMRETITQDIDPMPDYDRIQAQDILRGVIMSEILTRPDERRALQRSRQRTNGYGYSRDHCR